MKQFLISAFDCDGSSLDFIVQAPTPERAAELYLAFIAEQGFNDPEPPRRGEAAYKVYELPAITTQEGVLPWHSGGTEDLPAVLERAVE